MKIFISYSSNNRRQVTNLADDLKAMGHDVWYDTEIGWGHDWWNRILDEILSCDLFVFALTSSSLTSTACKREREYAGALRKRILPVRLAEVVMEALPSELQVLQTKPYDRADKTQALALAKAIFELRVADALPDPLPNRPENPMPFARLADTLQSDTLHHNQQATLLNEIKLTLQEPKNARIAWEFLDQLSARHDVTASVKAEIAELESRRKRDLQVYRRTRWFEPRKFIGHSKAVTDLVFTPNSHRLLTSGSDFTVRLWDCETGEEIERVRHPANILSVMVYDGENFVTLGDDGIVRVYSIASKKCIAQFAGPMRAKGIELLPTQKLMLLGEDNERNTVIQMWDVRTQELISELTLDFTLQVATALGPRGNVVAIAVSWMASKELLLWTVGAKQVEPKVRLPAHPRQVSFAPNGTWVLVSLEGDTARAYAVESGLPHSVFSGLPSRGAIDISHHERVLIATSDQSYAPITIHDGQSGAEVLQCRSSEFALPKRIKFSPDGRYIAAAFESHAQIWPLDLL